MLEKLSKTKARVLCLVLAVFMLLAVAGCGNTNTPSGDSSGTESATGGVQGAEIDTSDSTIANKKYDGEYFRMLYRWEPGDITKRTIEAFNKEHDAYIEYVVDNSSTVYEAMATAIASGDPYDIVSVYDYYFPNMITQDLVTPLQSYYTDVDLYDAAKPERGGINKQFTEHYTLNGNVYAVGSENSVYQLMMVYNKKLFGEAGLEDPWTLYKDGKWTWDKFVEMGNSVTDKGKGIAFTNLGDVHAWLALTATNVIEKTGENTFRSRAKDADVINVLKEYQNLYLGKNPLCVTGSDFEAGTQYTNFVANTAYEQQVNIALKSTAFDNNASNLGVTPCPIPNVSKSKTYPVHASTGYASCVGAKDPSVAVCFALFESRIVESETGEATQMPIEVSKAIKKEYSKAPSFFYDGFANSAGTEVGTYYRDKIGKPIYGGADVTQTLSNAHSVIENMIASSLKK